ncbi:hypothetical protein, partial [Mesorhizobium sp.]|uniref:hypothetical protein n=1 Tax=Mesorhizobium sp. TaxID=1871066 RepID=UPI0025CE989D
MRRDTVLEINKLEREMARQSGSILKNLAKGLTPAHGRQCGPTPSKPTSASGYRAHPVHTHIREDSH